MAQLTGIGATALFVFVGSLVIWMIIKALMGIRVTLHEEIEGLDIGEHGNSAYPEFASRKQSYTFLGLASRSELTETARKEEFAKV